MLWPKLLCCPLFWLDLASVRRGKCFPREVSGILTSDPSSCYVFGHVAIFLLWPSLNGMNNLWCFLLCSYRSELSSPLQNISVTFPRSDWIDRAEGAPLDHLGISGRALYFFASCFPICNVGMTVLMMVMLMVVRCEENLCNGQEAFYHHGLLFCCPIQAR